MRTTLVNIGRTAALCALALALSWLSRYYGVEARFVPYQLMVLLAGYFLPMNWSVGCAAGIPILNLMVFGFPEPLVALPLVVCQMIAVAAFTNFFYTMLEMNVYAVVPLALMSGFTVLFCAAAIYGAVSNHAVEPFDYLRRTLMITWPGLAVQIVVAPSIVLVVRRLMEAGTGNGGPQP